MCLAYVQGKDPAPNEEIKPKEVNLYSPTGVLPSS